MLPRFSCGIRTWLFATRTGSNYIMMIWNFAFGTCHGRGALNRFLVVLILIETRAVLIMKVSPGVNIFMRWVFNFCLF